MLLTFLLLHGTLVLGQLVAEIVKTRKARER